VGCSAPSRSRIFPGLPLINRQIDFPDGAAVAVEVTDGEDLPSAVDLLGLQRPRPTVVVVGGAGGLDQADIDGLRPIFASGIVPALERHRAAVVDGGTLAGVMRLCGETRAALSASFPLVGVVAAGTVQLPGRSAPPDGAALEPRHSHFMIVPGDTWGAEAPWILHVAKLGHADYPVVAQTASVLAGTSPSITVLVNGGQIAYDDVERSVQVGRRVVVVAGSGRTADALAGAMDGAPSDERAQALIASGLINSVPADQPAALAELLEAVLGEQLTT
jgi:hypothetical protein